MNERISVVTGGTGGIGRAVAVRLAETGDRVLIAGRDRARGTDVVAALRAGSPKAAHAHLPADLSLLADTARLADRVESVTSQVDSLVLCAGVYAAQAEWTEEGLERTFALNYLSRFLLISRLLPLLSAAPAGRIVIVASAGQYKDTIDLEKLRTQQAHPRRHLAGASQFANDLLAVELAVRLAGTGVEVTCVYPGLARTDVFRNARGVPAPIRVLARGIQRVAGHRAEEAAATPAYLAQDPRATGVNGQFFGPGAKAIPVPASAADADRRAALWTASEDVVTASLAASETGAAG